VGVNGGDGRVPAAYGVASVCSRAATSADEYGGGRPLTRDLEVLAQWAAMHSADPTHEHRW